MESADVRSDRLQARDRRQAAVAERGYRALESADVGVPSADAEIAVASLPGVCGGVNARSGGSDIHRTTRPQLRTQRPYVYPCSRISGRQEWTISVRDRGIGTAPADADRIFRVFDRLHAAEECDDTGIGLALCRRLAERHGAIAADSTPDEGAALSVTPPAPDADTATGPTTDHE